MPASCNTFCKDKIAIKYKHFPLMEPTVFDSVLASLCSYRGACALMAGLSNQITGIFEKKNGFLTSPWTLPEPILESQSLNLTPPNITWHTATSVSPWSLPQRERKSSKPSPSVARLRDLHHYPSSDQPSSAYILLKIYILPHLNVICIFMLIRVLRC